MNAKQITFVIVCIFMMTCGFQCTSNNTASIGDGKVDEVESATIRVAVGMTFTAKPELVPIAYGVSTALLDMIGTNTISTTTDMLSFAVDAQLNKLNLDAATKASFNDLVNLIKVKIKAQIKDVPVDQNEKIIVIRDIVKIIQETALARMATVTK